MDRVSFKMGQYDKAELLYGGEGYEDSMIVRVYDWWESDDEFDEVADLELSRADAKTLGQLLLRYADTGKLD